MHAAHHVYTYVPVSAGTTTDTHIYTQTADKSDSEDDVETNLYK